MMAVMIIEENRPDMITLWGAAARGFQKRFAQMDLDLDICIAAASFVGIELESLNNIVSLHFTCLSVARCADAAEAASQRKAIKTVFVRGIASWGSCNGLQLAAVVLGGSVQEFPNGLEEGAAQTTRKTDAEKAHLAFKGRPDSYFAPCIHRKEVKTLPPRAVLVAENNHSPVQSFAHAQDGIDFWVLQNQPELENADIVSYLKKPGTLSKKRVLSLRTLSLRKPIPLPRRVLAQCWLIYSPQCKPSNLPTGLSTSKTGCTHEIHPFLAL